MGVSNSGTIATLTNSGTISGGNGAVGGAGVPARQRAARACTNAGDDRVAHDVANSGTISGGNGGAAAARGGAGGAGVSNAGDDHDADQQRRDQRRKRRQRL